MRHDDGDRAQGSANGQPVGQSAPQVPVRALVLATTGLIVVIVAFFASYTSALGKPSARHIPLAVTASPAAVRTLDASPLLGVRPVAGLTRGRSLVEDRTVDGALALPVAGPATLLVAGGAGHAVQAVLVQVGERAAAARASRLNVIDVAPTSPGDPNGLVEFYCVVFLGIGGAAGAMALYRISGPVRGLSGALQRLGLVVLYSGALSVIVTVFADVVFGALIGHFGLLFLALWAFVTAVCLAVTGFAARFGLAAAAVLILAFIALGNPSSAGAVPRPLLNGLYSWLNPVLPQGAALSALRGVQYFGSHGNGVALLCLLLWAAAGLVLLLAAGMRGPRRGAVTAS